MRTTSARADPRRPRRPPSEGPTPAAPEAATRAHRRAAGEVGHRGALAAMEERGADDGAGAEAATGLVDGAVEDDPPLRVEGQHQLLRPAVVEVGERDADEGQALAGDEGAGRLHQVAGGF